jgi:hypothetical protein
MASFTMASFALSHTTVPIGRKDEDEDDWEPGRGSPKKYRVTSARHSARIATRSSSRSASRCVA